MSNPERGQRDHLPQGNITRRGDVHSDLVGRGMGGMGGAYNSGTAGFMATPSPGSPRYSGYQYQEYNPRGRKNPTKRMSDDARKGTDTSTSQHPSFSRGPSGPWQQVRSPESIRSPSGPAIQPYFPVPPGGGPNWHPYDLRNITPGYPPGVENNAPPHFSHGNVHQTQAGGQKYSQGRYTSNPFLYMPERPIGQGSCAQNMSFAPGQAHVHNQLIVDPNAFGNRLPGYQSDFVGQYNPEQGVQRTALASISNAGQTWTQRTPERSRPGSDGRTIWVGGLPVDINHVEVVTLLEQCRGFVSTTGPITSKAKQSNAPFCFAE